MNMRELNLVKEIKENALLIQDLSYNHCVKHKKISREEARRDLRVINDLAHRCIKLSEKLDTSLRYRENQGPSAKGS